MMDGVEQTSTKEMPPNEDFDLFGKHKVLPRVGDEYQVSLPELIPKTNYNSLTEGNGNPSRDGKVSSGSSLSSSSFNTMEEASFILAVYIFERNFRLVKDFIGGSRTMGDVLAHFYGAFYGSDRHHKWSDCRKRKTRKCACGAKIFTGLRQQKLLSRLLPLLSKEDKSKLQEISQSFEDGEILLKEYASSVKDIVGLNNLVEAVGIGKGNKQDLTRPSMQPKMAVARKACSELSTAEIVSFLQRRNRSSKAKFSDLFWEAVWPRLLAKGWQSEKAWSCHYSLGSKNSLAFLVPGVDEDLPRRKLVKGKHFFDSVNHVLKKVASEPSLLEIEGDSLNNDINSDQEDSDSSPGKENRCYLKLNTPQSHGKTDSVQFTIVDTTIIADGESGKIRELRDFPVESNRNCVETKTNARDHRDCLGFNMLETDIFKIRPFKIKSSKKVSLVLKGVNKSQSKEELHRNCQDSKKTSSSQEKGSVKIEPKTQKGSIKESYLDHHHVYKRRCKLSASSGTTIDKESRPKLIAEESSSSDVWRYGTEEPQLMNLNSSILPEERVEVSEEGNAHVDDEKVEDGVGANAEVNTSSDSVSCVTQIDVVDSRRQSGRNRLMSKRALESLELGFMDTKRRRIKL